MSETHSPPRFVERFIDGGGERVRVLEAGKGEPLVILRDDARAEPGLAEYLLSESYRVIIVNVTGTPRQAGAAIAALIAPLGVNQVALLASSLAASVALWLAVDCPERIRALVLESPLAFSLHAQALADLAAKDWPGCLNAHPERKPAGEPPDAAAFATMAQERITPAQDEVFAAKLPAFDPPVLTLFGTRDKLAPVELGRFYKSLFPNSWFLMVYDAAHDIRGDRPEAFAEVVADFLRRGAQFTVGERSSRINR